MSRKPARAEHPVQFRPEASRRARAELEFEEATILGALFGQFDVVSETPFGKVCRWEKLK